MSTPVAIDRATYIGSSDIAAILGMSPWQTPFQCWERKTRRSQDVITPEKERFFRRRKNQEAPIIQMFGEEYPGAEVTTISLDANPNRHPDPVIPYFAAEVDFEFLLAESVRLALEPFADMNDGTRIGGEIKTVHPFSAKKWGEEGSEDVPIEYATQVQWQLGCRPDIAAGCVVALFGLDDLRLYPILRDAAVIAWMREKANEFWHKHVLADVPPPAVNLEDAQRMFRQLSYRPVAAHPALVEALAKVAELRSRASAIEQAVKAAESIMGVEISLAVQWSSGDAGANDELAFLGANDEPLATWKKQSRTTVDGKRLSAEMPSVFKRFAKRADFRVLRFPSTKE